MNGFSAAASNSWIRLFRSVGCKKLPDNRSHSGDACKAVAREPPATYRQPRRYQRRKERCKLVCLRDSPQCPDLLYSTWKKARLTWDRAGARAPCTRPIIPNSAINDVALRALVLAAAATAGATTNSAAVPSIEKLSTFFGPHFCTIGAAGT